MWYNTFDSTVRQQKSEICNLNYISSERIGGEVINTICLWNINGERYRNNIVLWLKKGFF